MSEDRTYSWDDMSPIDKKRTVLNCAESYAQGVKELTGKDVQLSLSFGHHPNCENGVAVFTIEVEL